MYRRIPRYVRAVITLLQENKHQAYLVGGCVRDLLRGVSPRDWDVATSALPSQVENIFPRVLPTGVEFGTVTVVCEEGQVEVTTMRRDGVYRDGRHPSQVTFGQDIREDLLRRDFTINALAYDPQQDELVDPTGGLWDLRAGILRAVGDPYERFGEDALRLLRAIRLSGQVGVEIEAQTWQALCALHGNLKSIARERIGQEVAEILALDEVVSPLTRLDESGLLKLIFPSLYSQNRYPPAVSLKTSGYLPPVLHLRLAGLLLGTAAAPLLKGLHLGKDFNRRVTHLIDHINGLRQVPPDPASLRYFLSRLGPENLKDLKLLALALGRAGGWEEKEGDAIHHRLGELDRLTDRSFPLSPRELAIDGHDLRQYLQIRPGPRVGAILEELWFEVLADPSRNRRDYLLSRARQMKPL